MTDNADEGQGKIAEGKQNSLLPNKSCILQCLKSGPIFSMGQLIIHFTQQSSLYFAYNLSLTAWGRCQKCPCIPKQLGDLGRILFYITFTPCSPLGILCKSLIPNSCQYFGLSDFHRNLREIYSTSLLCKFKTYPLRFQKQSVARDTIKKSGTILHCFQILTDYFFLE